jgi:hypothetical protein
MGGDVFGPEFPKVVWGAFGGTGADDLNNIIFLLNLVHSHFFVKDGNKM